ncbi:MAG TPA: FtsX-like permease family protein [Microthrixaceae bacterium]|jgi:ABC-type antimicrobial peptide transport system permease subunit|nr:FtsX-like permease family protein [Microthrixaceae bacterium]
MMTGTIRSRLRIRAHLDDVGSTVLSRPGRIATVAALTAVGIGSAVAVLGLAEATRVSVSDRFAAQRSTFVTAQLVDTSVELPDDAAQRVEDINGATAAVVLTELGQRDVSSGGFTSQAPVVRFAGSLEAALDLNVPGQPADADRSIVSGGGAFVGSGVARDLSLGPVGLGPTVSVDGIPCPVLGVITSSPEVPALLTSVLVTRSAEVALGGGSTTIAVQVDAGYANSVARSVGDALVPNRPEAIEGSAVFDTSSLGGQVDSDVRDLVVVVAAVVLAGAVLAGGLSAYSSVTSRRPEIGLRRVMGARPIHIFVLVLSETCLAGLLGGFTGGWAGAALVLSIRPAGEPILDPRYLVAAPVLGLTIGLVSGFLPAIGATRISPSAAFRYV